MSDTSATSDNKEDKGHTRHKRKKTHHHTGLWISLILLLILGGLGYEYGWKNLQGLYARFTGLEAAMQGVRDETAGQLKQAGESVDKLADRQAHLEEGLDNWLEQNSHLRKDWLLAEAEYLIKLASHRLLLERDVKTAIVAMEGADARLADVGDPALLSVRKQLSQDMQKLKSVPSIDVAGISLTLSGLIQSVAKLPLQVPDPEGIRQRIQERTPEKRQLDGWGEFFRALWRDLKNLVVIRSHESPVQPMLTADQQFFLVQNLQLRLEQARLALLQGESGVYQERLKEMELWIPEYFDVGHELTKSTLDTLGKLRKQDVNPELPNLARSYEMLEKYLSSGSTYKSRKSKKAAPATDKPGEEKNPTREKPADKQDKPTNDPKQPPAAPPVKPEASATPQVKI